MRVAQVLDAKGAEVAPKSRKKTSGIPVRLRLVHAAGPGSRPRHFGSMPASFISFAVFGISLFISAANSAGP